MIRINKISPPTVEIYDPNDNLLGVANEYELLDVRVQIKKEQVWGYSLVFNGQKVRLDRNGELEDYPKGLLDTMSDFYMDLL